MSPVLREPIRPTNDIKNDLWVRPESHCTKGLNPRASRAWRVPTRTSAAAWQGWEGVNARTHGYTDTMVQSGRRTAAHLARPRPPRTRSLYLCSLCSPCSPYSPSAYCSCNTLVLPLSPPPRTSHSSGSRQACLSGKLPEPSPPPVNTGSPSESPKTMDVVG